MDAIGVTEIGNRRGFALLTKAVWLCAPIFIAFPSTGATAAPPIEFVFIPGSDDQPGGPTYDFRVSRFEIRNDQFVAFLNDALAHRTHQRGAYMFFNSDTGDVYINDDAAGEVGTESRAVKLFSPTVSRQIEWVNGAYAVVTTPWDYSAHPVAGVSWYGAIKYCNWLTLDVGLAKDDRIYTEAISSALSGWRPVGISNQDWSVRDLNATERDELLTAIGFRLPMDGGDAAANPDIYNEWFKTASRKPDGAQGEPVFGSIYGFGRDILDNIDANFRCSGDPFEDLFECIVGDTSPVGYFNGVNLLTDGSPTADTDNGYQIYDVSGNVWEWMQDQGFDPSDRRNRGGSFRSSPVSFGVENGAARNAGAVNDSTGFRIVQSVVNAFLVTPNTDLVLNGPWGGPYGPEQTPSVSYRVENLTDRDIGISVETDAAWLIIDYTPPANDILAPFGFVDVNVAVEPHCDDGHTIGTNWGIVTITNTTDQTSLDRKTRLTVTEPLTLEPTNLFNATMVFGDPSPSRTYTIKSESDLLVSWTATWSDTSQPTPPVTNWILINGSSTPHADSVPPLGSTTLEVSFDQSGLDVGQYNADVIITDDCTGATHTLPIRLTVKAPFDVSPTENVLSTGVVHGPFTPDEHLFTLTSRVDQSLDWRVSLLPIAPEVSTNWLEISPTGGTLPLRNEAIEVSVSFNLVTQLKLQGTYEVEIVFEHLATGFTTKRVLTLELSDVVVEPTEDISFSGTLGGPFHPASHTYSIHNTGMVEMPWRVEFVETSLPASGIDWLDLEPSIGIILTPTGSDDVVVTLSADTSLLGSGTYTGTLTFYSKSTGATTQREVTLMVGAEGFSLHMVQIPEEDSQPDGPDYLYRIARYEVSNTEFLRFLNDTLHNPSTPRAANLVHDTAAGTVLLSGDAAVLFDTAIGQAIEFTGGNYIALPGKEQLPVVGVSWYGAVKFCNWMTLIQAMNSPDQRAYTEGPTTGDFGTVAPPAQLINLRGFRLPMDDQSDTATPFNEWYKAAAWIDDELRNAEYGFGRDTIEPADANFLDSNDPAEPGPTVVGFYNGTNLLDDDTTLTNNTANGYGLFDLTGNVSEWIHNDGINASQRGVRGGDFQSVSTSTFLRNDMRGSLPTASTLSFVGFRVVQVIDPVAIVLSQSAGESARANGFVGGPYDFPGGTPGRTTLTLNVQNPGTQTIDRLSITFTPPWFEVVGVAPNQIAPGSTLAIPVRVADDAVSAGLSPSPSGDYALVRETDFQPNGPAYDFWIGRTEITNAQFASFLNLARANADSTTPDARSHYLYFDLDSANVCVHDQEEGAEGTDKSCDATTTLVYDASIGRIQLVDDAFEVEAGFANHPVVGVSWFGALKFCNWLTLQQGLHASLRAYEEGPDPTVSGWHPVVVDDSTWQANGLSPTARSLLVEDTLGFRLPMDDESATSSPFNEWYKFASRKPDDAQGDPVFDAIYGTGRDDPLESPDANFWDSGETKDNQTTVVGFFDGTKTLYAEPTHRCLEDPEDPTSTRDTDNGYAMFDLCGNVAEWMQDFGSDPPNDRATRGGSWRDDAVAPRLTTTWRDSQSPSAAGDDIGFRVVRGTGHAVMVSVTDNIALETTQRHIILDLHEPFQLDPETGMTITGTFGDDFSARSTEYTLTNRSDSPMSWEVSTDQDWIDLTGPVADELEGSLDGGTSLLLDVATNELANDLGPGTHQAIVILTNVTTGETIEREVEMTIDEPLTVTPDDSAPLAFTGLWGGPFTSPPSYDLSLESLVDFSLDYTIHTDQAWLDLEPQSDLSGTIDPGQFIDIIATVNDTADAFNVGDYEGPVTFQWTDSLGDGLSSSLTRTFTLQITDPIILTQLQEPWNVGPDLIALPSQTYSIENTHDTPIELNVSTNVNWLDVDTTATLILPGQIHLVHVDVNEDALRLFDGEYYAALSVENLSVGIQQCRNIVLSIGETLSVDPFDDLEASGIPGGPIEPIGISYRLTNVARDLGGVIDWSVQVTTPAVDWLLLNRQNASTGLLTGTLDDGESVTMVLSIDADATSTLAAGIYTASIEFTDLTNAKTSTRTVTLTLADAQFHTTQSSIPRTAEQFGGPQYSYVMSTYQTTNIEFGAFLNDALFNLDNERGAFLYFDTDSGDVYIHTASDGASGDSGDGIRVFNATLNPDIVYNPSLGYYEAIAGREDHPVTGVSWYGAIKYANWLTIDQGLPTSHRCYIEAPAQSPAAWRPVTITEADWSARDLNDQERQDLVTDCRGFRLPMDDGATNDVVTLDQADAFNEWYKAAAWDTAAGLNRTYGFGRDSLTAQDANYRDNGDPHDNDTTPVGFFDGTIKQGVFATNANQNSFGLYDMSGNVFHWMQGRFNTATNSINFRTARGGSWDDAFDSPDLQTSSRNLAPPQFTNARIGFRVVRVPLAADGDINNDATIDEKDSAALSLCMTGPGAPAALSMIPGCSALDLDEDGDIDLHDVNALEIMMDPS